MKAIKMMLLAGFLMLPLVSQAGVGDCVDEMVAVDNAIVAGGYTGKRASTDESNLLAKSAAARSKLDLDKFSDAVDKLLDISDKATALAGAQKSKLVDATDINDAVSDAIACIPSD